jgi:hypothetical protein
VCALIFGVPHSVSENSLDLFSGHRPRHVRGNPGVLEIIDSKGRTVRQRGLSCRDAAVDRLYKNANQ